MEVINIKCMKTMYSVLYIPWEFRCHILEHKTLASCFSTFIIKTFNCIFFQMHLSYFLISKSQLFSTQILSVTFPETILVVIAF